MPKIWTDGGMHGLLRRMYPKAGVCTYCGKQRGKTEHDYAFLRHPEPYTLDIEDYVELCKRCHMIMDQEFRNSKPRKPRTPRGPSPMRGKKLNLSEKERQRRKEQAKRLYRKGTFGGPQPGSGRPRKVSSG